MYSFVQDRINEGYYYHYSSFDQYAYDLTRGLDLYASKYNRPQCAREHASAIQAYVLGDDQLGDQLMAEWEATKGCESFVNKEMFATNLDLVFAGIDLDNLREDVYQVRSDSCNEDFFNGNCDGKFSFPSFNNSVCKWYSNPANYWEGCTGDLWDNNSIQAVLCSSATMCW